MKTNNNLFNVGDIVGISVSTLFNTVSEDLKHCIIEKRFGGNNEEYYDLFNNEGQLVCLDGEESKILKIEDREYFLQSVEEDDGFFILTEKEIGLSVYQ